MFVWWKEFTSHRSGHRDKWVTCESCGKDYVYTLYRRVFGVGRSPFFLDNKGAAERADERAAAKLEVTLDTDADARPCPHCGRFQTNMIPAARRSYLPGMGFLNCLSIIGGFAFLGFILLILNGVVRDAGPVVPWPVFFGIFGALLGFIALLPFIRLVLVSFYDPHREDATTRVQKGFFPGVTRADFDRTQAQQREINDSLFERVQRLRARLRSDPALREAKACEQALTFFLEPPRATNLEYEAAYKEVLRTVVALARLMEQMDHEVWHEFHRECALVVNGICMTQFGESVYKF